LPRDIGELIRHFIAFTKPPYPPGLQSALPSRRSMGKLFRRHIRIGHGSS
jgi:hypothetical protein